MKRTYSLMLFLLLVVTVPALVLSAGTALAACTGPGAPSTTQTKCLTAIQIPAADPRINPTGALRSFDISWVNPDRAEYYLADRSNAGIDIIDTRHNTFKRRLPGFVGIKLNANGTVNNNISGPDGVVTHGRWLYAGDGDSTLKVFDLNGPPTLAQPPIPTGGTTRVDEMALTADGKLLLAANNAEDPPFATLFAANGDAPVSNVVKIIKITIDAAIMPEGAGLSIEQPAWDPTTKRFYTSLPVIANNPTGCNYGQLGAGHPITCDGGLLVTDPQHPTAVQGAFDPTTNTGVVKLSACGPNGATVGPHANLLLGCTPQNNPSDTTTLVINAKSHNFANIGNITGSDEVWFNAGDNRYYTGSSRDCGTSGTCPDPTHGFPGFAVLGVIDAIGNLLIEKIPQSSASHSVAADSKRNFIYVPQAAPVRIVGTGGDITAVGEGICGSTNGCIAVYVHDVDRDRDRDRDDDDGRDHDNERHDR